MVEYNLSKTPIVDIVNQIILYAAQNKASDIHFDPREDSLMIRMRIDGYLHDHSIVPKAYERNLITRVKLVSNMNITENRLPQDGAIKGKIGGKNLDMRVSVLPTNSGEKTVIRILDFQKGMGGLETLGFSDENYRKINNMLQVSNGIILVTGATGTGKSTTTYSMLNTLNKEESNIITVEDPIEMNIEGINQVQVNPEIGMTFATALRSILRQDPNIILIGEIRDSETAQIAVRASITGHLVLSTIHTNDSLSTIERLLDMNVERYLLASAITGIVSQKLTRTLCPHCKTKRKVTKYEKHLFKQVLEEDINEVYDAIGCDQCHNGFLGRMAVQEVLYISEKLRDVLANEFVEKDELRKMVYDGNTHTMLQDALYKVVAGYTTFQEIYRIIDIDADLDNSIRNAVYRDKEAEKAVDADDIIDIHDKGITEIFAFDDEIFMYEEDSSDFEELDDGLDIFDTVKESKLQSFVAEDAAFSSADLVLDENFSLANLPVSDEELLSQAQTLELDEVVFDYKELSEEEIHKIQEQEQQAAGEKLYPQDEEALFKITKEAEIEEEIITDSLTEAPAEKEAEIEEVEEKINEDIDEALKFNKALRHKVKELSARAYDSHDIIDAFEKDFNLHDLVKEEKIRAKTNLEIIDAFEKETNKIIFKKARKANKNKLDVIDAFDKQINTIDVIKQKVKEK